MNKNIYPPGIVFAACLLCLGILSLVAADNRGGLIYFWEKTDIKNGLTISISMNSKTNSVGDEIVVEWTLRNDGKTPLSIDLNDFTAGYFFDFDIKSPIYHPVYFNRPIPSGESVVILPVSCKIGRSANYRVPNNTPFRVRAMYGKGADSETLVVESELLHVISAPSKAPSEPR